MLTGGPTTPRRAAAGNKGLSDPERDSSNTNPAGSPGGGARGTNPATAWGVIVREGVGGVACRDQSRYRASGHVTVVERQKRQSRTKEVSDTGRLTRMHNALIDDGATTDNRCLVSDT